MSNKRAILSLQWTNYQFLYIKKHSKQNKTKILWQIGGYDLQFQWKWLLKFWKHLHSNHICLVKFLSLVQNISKKTCRNSILENANCFSNFYIILLIYSVSVFENNLAYYFSVETFVGTHFFFTQKSPR